MKKGYESPKMVVEQFEANEYVAGCSEEHRYNFSCNAGSGNLYYYKTSDGKIDGVYTGTGSKTSLGSVQSCTRVHETSSTTEFYDGFLDRDKDGVHDEGEGVIVLLDTWTGPITGNEYVYNHHATSALDIQSWTTKS